MPSYFVAALLALLCGSSLTAAPAKGGETLRVGGTGAAQELLRQLGASFSQKTGSTIDLVPSLGSSGGIAALADNVLDVTVSGRPLRAEESAKGLTVALNFRTPFVFATSHPNPNPLSVTDIAKAYESETATWRDGTPVRVILRPRSESDSSLLAELFPMLVPAIAHARRRPDVPLAATDQDNASMAEVTPGSLVGSTLLQVLNERRDLRLVTVDGVEPTLENFARGQYRHGKTLYVVTREQPQSTVQLFVDFLLSSEGQVLLRQAHTL